MSDILLYAGALLSAGALISAILFSFGALAPPAKHWTALWATGLLLSAFVPLAGGAISAFAPSIEAPTILASTSVAFSGMFDASLFSGPGEAAGTPSPSFLSEHGAAVLFGIYLAVLMTLLARLAAGRGRAHMVARHAAGPYELDGIAYWVSPEADAPFAISNSLWRDSARIIIPARFDARLSDQALALILRHEHAHIERHDDQLGIVLRVVLAVSWFSPFAHLLFARWSQSAEIQCDAQAVADRAPEMRRAFANTLLEALHITADRVRQYPAASFSTHRIWSEKMRINQIMKGSPAVFKRSAGRMLLAGFALPVATIGALTVAAHGKDSTVPAAAAATQQVVTQVKIVDGKITARFGQRADPFDNGKVKMHTGVDIAAPIGTPIRAPADGVIVTATNVFDNQPAYGLVVVHLAGDGTQTLFSHLNAFSVSAGQNVRAGQQIATVGNSGRSTGPHVHIETIRNGERVDPQTVWPMLQ